MIPPVELEKRRQKEQSLLDNSKDALERNRFGQFATPPQLALEIVRMALKCREGSKDEIHFLEPGFGTGAFYSALWQIVPEEIVGSALGVELDHSVAQAARKLWQSTGISIIEGDFTRLTPSPLSTCPNLIICNPPYVRHHHLDPVQKQYLQAEVQRRTGLAINGLAGMYCYFLLLSHQWLSDEGLGVWLIPTEFMDVNYGKAIRDYLTKHVTLLRLHRFESADVQFADALVSSAIVVFQKAIPRKGHEAVFTIGGTLTNPRIETGLSIDTLAKSNKWTKLPDVIQSYSSDKYRDITLGDLFKTRRGIATGANNFFVLRREEAKELKLPETFLRPILPSPRYLESCIIEADSDGFPSLSPQLVLVDCRLQQEQIRSLYPALWKYLESGKQLGIHKRYLASKRSPWYRQEDISPSPFICTYMGRNEGDLVPFRFIWNQSQAIAPNVYLLLYPRDHLAALLKGNPERERQVFELLQRIDMKSLIGEGRTYGGGLHKIEPQELHNVLLTNISEAQDLIATTMLF